MVRIARHLRSRTQPALLHHKTCRLGSIIPITKMRRRNCVRYHKNISPATPHSLLAKKKKKKNRRKTKTGGNEEGGKKDSLPLPLQTSSPVAQISKTLLLGILPTFCPLNGSPNKTTLEIADVWVVESEVAAPWTTSPPWE